MLRSVFYLSLTVDVYSQIKSADKHSREWANFVSQDSNGYLYEKDIYFTPARVTFQCNAASPYIYISESKFKKSDLDNLHIEIIRDCYGEIQKSKFYYSEFEEGIESFHLPGYYCFVLPPVRVYPDYNELKIRVAGLRLSDPDNDLKIMLFFNGIKRRTIFLEYLVKGLVALTGFVLTFVVYALTKKLLIRKTPPGDV